MNKHHPSNNIIERKLEQLTSADADLLWNDMHSILDKKMPQKKERRRFMFWLLSGKTVLLLIVAAFISGSSIFFLTTKQSSVATTKTFPENQQSNKLMENDAKQISKTNKINTTTLNKSGESNKSNISAIIVSDADNMISYSFNSPQTIKRFEKNITNDQSNEQFQTFAITRQNFEITPLQLRSISHDNSIVTNHNKEIDSLLKKSELTTNNNKSNNRKNNEKGFYAGVMSGIDLSSIGFRSVRAGSTKGFIVGYAINEKWSLESGLFWDTKRVYDNGSNFTPPGYTPTSGITITAVNGKSSIYELPVNVKYTFLSGKHNLFATTGLSSYLMRSENYDYKYLQNNQPGGHNYLSYKNETKNWLSVANFSLGYTHKLGNAGSIRVEPYLKLPLKNIGIGNMPIMSTGLNVGFTKTLK